MRNLSLDSESEEETLCMDQVRFSSCSILPSHTESCKLEKSEVGQTKVYLTDFQMIRSLSSGAFGTVFLSKKKQTNDLFAIKVMDKANLVTRKMTDFIMVERNVLTKADSDYLVRGMWTFQTEKYLYLVMEYMRGGDFNTQLNKYGKLNTEVTKFVIAHVVAGLEHLHSNGIIHRDLKPDNMLISADGHIKLTDFGLSYEADQDKGKKRIIGTADYIAPEVVSMQGTATFLVDYWAVGIILYECLTGKLPFNAQTEQEVFRNILNMPIVFPEVGFEED